MKTQSIHSRLVIPLILLTISMQNGYSQVFRTLEQYQDHFIKNYNTLDKIEGIWLVKNVITPAEYNKDSEDSYIAIIKENAEFKGYSLKNGVYSPGNNKLTFYAKGNAQYLLETFNYATSEKIYDDFAVSDNYFQTTNDLTSLLAKQLGTDVLLYLKGTHIILKMTFVKIYPLESDQK